jgi:type IV pilus assembly protein PilW
MERNHLAIEEKRTMKGKSRSGCDQGFTLLELLVVILILSVVMAGVYSVYTSQQKSFLIQEDVAEMQQNLRAAMFTMVREIRLAGCNPTGKANAGIVTANANTISVTMDICGNNPNVDPPDGDTGDLDEAVTYALTDADSDGTVDSLVRIRPGDLVPPLVASNIDALNFVYLDGNGNVSADLTQIRTVQLTVVARTENPSVGFRNTASYRNLQGAVVFTAPGDSFRRKVFATNIRCRNLGLL